MTNIYFLTFIFPLSPPLLAAQPIQSLSSHYMHKQPLFSLLAIHQTSPFCDLNQQQNSILWSLKILYKSLADSYS